MIVRHGHLEYRKYGPLFIVERWPEDPDTWQQAVHRTCAEGLALRAPDDKCAVCRHQLYPTESALSFDGGRPWAHWPCLMGRIDARQRHPAEDRALAVRAVRAPMRGQFRVPAPRS